MFRKNKNSEKTGARARNTPIGTRREALTNEEHSRTRSVRIYVPRNRHTRQQFLSRNGYQPGIGKPGVPVKAIHQRRNPLDRSCDTPSTIDITENVRAWGKLLREIDFTQSNSTPDGWYPEHAGASRQGRQEG